MKKSVVGAAVMAGVAFAASAQAQAQMTADVVHWWTSGGESRALKTLAEGFKARGGTWKDSAVVGGSAARAAAVNRILGGDPPTAMQWNMGVDLANLGRQGMLASIDEAAGPGKWKQVLPGLVVEKATQDGRFIAAPVAIHADNWMWFNQQVFAKLNLKAPTSWDGFLADAPRIKAAGVIPVALGGQPWQERILFNSVLIGVAGKQAYRKIYVDRDEAFAKDPSVVKAIKTFKDLKAFVDDGSPGRNWNDSTNLVISGKAAVQFMGDWAKGEFAAAGLTPGKEYGCQLAPGNQDAYVMVVDVFAFPKTKGADKASTVQKTLAETILDPATQVAFSRIKGSVPARTDVDVSGFDACVQLGRSVLVKAENQLPNFAMAMPGSSSGIFEDTITKIWNDKSMDVAAAANLFASAVRQAR